MRVTLERPGGPFLAYSRSNPPDCGTTVFMAGGGGGGGGRGGGGGGGGGGGVGLP